MRDVLLEASVDPASYPLWVLFTPAVLKTTGSFATSLTSLRTVDGEKYAPVFTDKDLALRYVEEQQQVGNIELMPVENLTRLRMILEIYHNKGVPNVGTDCSTRQFQQFLQWGGFRTISIFLRELDARGLK